MDKAAERKIFDLVYGDEDSLTVVEGERPDFTCTTKDGLNFGVEVTEFYISESMARLRQRPNYTQQLLTEKRYLHKDDKENIPVSKVMFRLNSDGTTLQTEAIVGEFLTRGEIAERLITRIADKSSKIQNYAEIDGDIDLIINDVEAALGSADVENLIYVLEEADAKSTIVDSRFRDIFLVTEIAGENSYIPLRANFFAREVFAFRSLAQDFTTRQSENISNADFLNSLAHYLDHQFHRAEVDVSSEHHVEFIFASIALRFDAAGRWRIRDVSREPRRNRTLLKSELVAASHSKLLEFVKAERPNEFFCLPIAFPATRDRNFCF
jgi:hypothetical protein